VWFLDSTPLGHCFRCDTTFWPDKANGWIAPSLAEMEKWRKRQEQVQLERKAKAESALVQLRSGHVWEQYHQLLDDQARAYWQKRGIAPSYQDWWQLGWRPRWSFQQPDGSWLHTPSATIPLFGPDWQPLNVKHRLIDPPPNRGKYLYELSGLPAPLFRCDPENDLAGPVLVVEGEIKAMVVYATLDDTKARVVGLPGVNPAPHIIEELAEAESLILVGDPGARLQVWKLTKQLGRKRCRVLIPPVKCDDGILASGMSGNELRALLRNAVPCA